MSNFLQKTNPSFIAAIAGLLSFALALAPASGSAWGLLLFLAASYPLLLIGRLSGIQHGSIATAVAFILMVLSSTLSAGFIFAGMIGFPVIVMLYANTYQNDRLRINNILIFLTGYFALLMIGVYYLSFMAGFDIKAFLTGLSEAIYSQIETLSADKGNFTTLLGDKENFIQLISKAIMGFSSIYIILILLLNWLFASLSLKKIDITKFKPLESIQEIRMPLWFFVSFLGLIAINFISPNFFISGALSTIFSFNIFLVGLAIIHCLNAAYIPKGQRFTLALFYSLLLFISWMGLIILLLGTLDQIINIRKFIQTKTVN